MEGKRRMTKQKRTSYGGSGTGALLVHGRAWRNARKKVRRNWSRGNPVTEAVPLSSLLFFFLIVPPCLFATEYCDCGCMYSRIQFRVAEPDPFSPKRYFKTWCGNACAQGHFAFDCSAFAVCGLVQWLPLDGVLTPRRAWRLALKKGSLWAFIIMYLHSSQPQCPNILRSLRA